MDKTHITHKISVSYESSSSNIVLLVKPQYDKIYNVPHYSIIVGAYPLTTSVNGIKIKLT